MNLIKTHSEEVSRLDLKSDGILTLELKAKEDGFPKIKICQVTIQI